RGRDRGRVRRAGAPDPEARRADLPGGGQAAGGRAQCRDRPGDLERSLRHGRRLGPRPLRPRAAARRAPGDVGAVGDGGEDRAHTSGRGAAFAAHPAANGEGRVTLAWIAVLCLLTTMFFSAAEMAFIAANRLRLRHLAEEGSKTAARYLEAFSHPERILSTAMMGVTISHIVASSITTVLLLETFGGWAWLVTTAVITPIMLVFGEIIPKAVAREWATSLILRLFRPLRWASTLLVPFVFTANVIVSG